MHIAIAKSDWLILCGVKVGPRERERCEAIYANMLKSCSHLQATLQRGLPAAMTPTYPEGFIQIVPFAPFAAEIFEYLKYLRLKYLNILNTCGSNI